MRSLPAIQCKSRALTIERQSIPTQPGQTNAVRGTKQSSPASLHHPPVALAFRSTARPRYNQVAVKLALALEHALRVPLHEPGLPAQHHLRLLALPPLMQVLPSLPFANEAPVLHPATDESGSGPIRRLMTTPRPRPSSTAWNCPRPHSANWCAPSKFLHKCKSRSGRIRGSCPMQWLPPRTNRISNSTCVQC